MVNSTPPQNTRCSHCHKPSDKLVSVPKIYDFSFKHAMVRLGVPLKHDMVDFQKYSYYFETDKEKNEFISKHPDMWVIDWYHFCPACHNNSFQSPNSCDRLMRFMERMVGRDRFNQIVLASVVSELPRLLKEAEHAEEIEQNREKRINWKLGL